MTESTLRALILDDDPDTLDYQTVLLEGLGFAVDKARSIRGIMEFLKKKPDVVLMDMMLPERDGIQVIEAFAKAKLESALVLMSAVPNRVLSAAESIARLSGLTVLGHLRKPVWEEDLKRVLDPLLESAHMAPEVEEDELRRLVSTGNLVNHYQPVIDAQRATVHSIEALSRLHHPVKGVISPSSLWEAADMFAASMDLQTHLLDSAIADAVKFAERGHRIVVSCNMPSDQVGSSEFVDRLQNKCRSAGLLLSSLSLEVNESDIRQNFLPALISLTRLGMRGLLVTIDDYGAGCLTEGMLAHLPVNELKIGMGLIEAALGDSEARTRIIDLVDYGFRHEMRVIAKGVESEEQLGLLMDLGVMNFQGFLFSEPRGFEETLYWLKGAPKRLAELGLTSHMRTTGEQRAVP